MIGVADDSLAIEKKRVWDSLNVVEVLHRLRGFVGFPHRNDVGIAVRRKKVGCVLSASVETHSKQHQTLSR